MAFILFPYLLLHQQPAYISNVNTLFNFVLDIYTFGQIAQVFSKYFIFIKHIKTIFSRLLTAFY